ncbi:MULTISPECIES: hypothetical protein [unclassified Streptomyces]|uniref:hypothetical protein n=1 Tax=unclassified Streptomyces TaxID=2593676 RepID=UPI0035D7A625
MEIISRVRSADGSIHPRHTFQALADLRRHEFIEYLQAILNKDAALDSVANRSSVHANGFTKLVLERSPEIALRLHVWEPCRRKNEEEQIENIHDHVWPFMSRVLLGGLGEERFGVSRHGPLMDHYRYVRGRATLPPGALVFHEQVRLETLDHLSHLAGTVYEVDNTVLHRARNFDIDTHTVTLVLTGVPRRTPASVYTRAGLSIREDVQNARVSTDSVRQLIGWILEAL